MIYDVSDGYFKSFLEAEGVAAHKFFSALGIHLQEEEGSASVASSSGGGGASGTA